MRHLHACKYNESSLLEYRLFNDKSELQRTALRNAKTAKQVVASARL